MDNTEEVESVYGERTVVSNFSTGEVLRLTFSVFGKNPALYLVLALFAEAPKILLGLFMAEEQAEKIGSFTTLLISVIFTGAIAYGVYKGLVGERVGLGEAVSRGLSRYFSLIGLSLVFGILMVGIVIVAAFLGVVGMFLSAVSILYLLCMYAVATPACVVERLGPLQSMGRSATLTKGRRWSVLGLFIISGGCVFVMGLLDGFVLVINETAGGVFAHATTILLAALTQIGVSVLYFQLRASKEGVGVSELARVFE